MQVALVTIRTRGVVAHLNALFTIYYCKRTQMDNFLVKKRCKCLTLQSHDPFPCLVKGKGTKRDRQGWKWHKKKPLMNKGTFLSSCFLCLSSLLSNSRPSRESEEDRKEGALRNIHSCSCTGCCQPSTKKNSIKTSWVPLHPPEEA